VNPLAFELLASLALGGAVGIAAFTLVGQGETVSAARMRRLSVPDEERPKRGMSWDEVRRGGLANLPVMRNFILQTAWAERLRLEIEQAGLRLHVGEYLAGRALLAFIAFVAVFGLGRSVPTFVLALGAGGIGFMVPAVWLNGERARRRERLAKQLPEAAQSVATALRAGFSLQHGLAVVADQMESPIAEEFNRVNIDLNVGSTIEESLLALLQRNESAEMNLFITAILVQRSSGGNLAEILEMVAEQMRETQRLVGEVRTMTAQQRFSGIVLAVWPMLLLGVFALLNWHQTSLLFTTTVGVTLLGIALGLEFLGYLAIRKILSVNL